MDICRNYKESGIFWQPSVPEEWVVTRLKHVLLKLSRERNPEDELLVCSNSGDVKKRGDSKLGLVAESNDIYQGVKAGDLLIHGMDTWHGAIAVSEYDGMCTPVVHVCDSTQNKKYVALYLRNMASLKIFKLISNGVRQNTSDFRSWDKLANIPIPLPPLAEQEKIVSYLEDKTSKIDAYVADKEKEIELLQELKQKTIADAVTKGLNPDAKMKDSGISWIGEIPEHWETRRAKFMFIKNKRERRPEDEVITCFRDGQVTLRKNRRLTGFTESEKYDGYQGIRKGDLVIHQMDAFAGSIGVSDSDGMGTSVYHCCTPTGDYNVYYYAYLIRQMALSGFIQSLYKGIRERSSDFSFPVFGNQFLLIPPKDEQQSIVAYIEEKCEKIDKLASELQSEIDYLKEYKQRLIADCVTGQVKV